MMEDKLSTDQRVRLECLAQAVARAGHTKHTEEVIKDAEQFEQYVRGLR